MPVLYGVFLYMGVSSLKGIQVGEGVRPPSPVPRPSCPQAASLSPHYSFYLNVIKP